MQITVTEMILAVLNLQAVFGYLYKIIGGLFVITVHILGKAQLIKIGRSKLKAIFGGKLKKWLSGLEFFLFIIGLTD
jgi:hypothetical protein